MVDQLKTPTTHKGPIAWMATNSVAANLLMIVLILGGILFAFQIKQEVFPEFTIETVTVQVPYPGASPKEVEQGVLLAVEDNVRGLEGIKEIVSYAQEGMGTARIELLDGNSPNKALQDIKNAVDRISSFPEEAERPIVSLVALRKRVVTLVVAGKLESQSLRSLAEEVRDELSQEDGITYLELRAVQQPELSIEVPSSTLRRYDLTLNEIAEIIRTYSLEVPGGTIRSTAGQILLRTQERRDTAEQFESIPVLTGTSGTPLELARIASIQDDFEESDLETAYNGDPAILIDVYRVGTETPISVSDTVKRYIAQKTAFLPPGVHIAIWDDASDSFRGRMNLLLKNAQLGLILVLIALGVFLDIKLAFWVTLGIPISILGAFLFIPLTGASINMISLFAFIITLGIIVDDAVVMGENIHNKRQEGLPPLEAAIVGAKEIATPVVFAVLTNIAAFLPLMFVPGSSGKLFRQIPSVTVIVFLISLIESIFVLPAHLAHPSPNGPLLDRVGQKRRIFIRWLDSFITTKYKPVAELAITHRYPTIGIALALLFLTIGFVGAGFMQFSFLPKIDTDIVSIQVRLPYGTPLQQSYAARDILYRAGLKTTEQLGGPGTWRGTLTQIGQPLLLGGPAALAGPSANGAHQVGMQIYLAEAEKRDFSAVEFAKKFRENLEAIPGIESLLVRAEINASQGSAIDIELTHRSTETLEASAEELAELLPSYAGVQDVDSGISRGKRQLNFELSPQAIRLGLRTQQVASQLRAAFYGIEAVRQQRGRNEVKVRVRLPKEERETLHTLTQYMIVTPQGGKIPLREAVVVNDGFSYTQIQRRNGRRVLSVTADVDRTRGNPSDIVKQLEESVLPTLARKHPGLRHSLEGEQASQRESLSALGTGYIIALLCIFSLLAIPFNSYIQPAIVMISIPFGIIGAVLGHVILGYGLSIISLFGIIALSGVVVNDSLVLVVTANENLKKGLAPESAVLEAGIRRFRPIILTSITTFLGLAPMIFETALQARFLIPMAISIGFGILFSTIIILVLVPAVYVALYDYSLFLERLRKSKST
jgi:multidrug efflux pump subunit AcrB